MSVDNAAIAKEKSKWRDLSTRTLTALIMAAVSLALILAGSWWFAIAMILVALQMNREWQNIAPVKHVGWQYFGVIYIIIPMLCVLQLRLFMLQDSTQAIWAILTPVLLVIATDIGAFFAGRTFGGPKLAPALSPKKTWSGLTGGMIASIIVSLAILGNTPWPQATVSAVFLAITATILAQSGDLFESWLKRRRNVKDSGELLPGHGGFLDRMDGYVLVLPFYTLMLWLNTA